MSERNKKFRSQCNIDVLLDKENNSLQVKVTYKPEMFTLPMSRIRSRYSCTDVICELERQGFDVDSKYHKNIIIDNTSSNITKHSASLSIPLSGGTKEKSNMTATATPPNPKSSSKKTTKTKTTNK